MGYPNVGYFGLARAMDKSTDTAAYQVLLKLLRELRESQDLFQADLADRLGEHQSFISKCENGERRLDLIELRQWCEALGVPLVEFIQRLEKRIQAGS